MGYLGSHGTKCRQARADHRYIQLNKTPQQEYSKVLCSHGQQSIGEHGYSGLRMKSGLDFLSAEEGQLRLELLNGVGIP